MSLHEATQPICHDRTRGPVIQVIEPHEKDLGGFTVRRLLPAAKLRRVGPFIFLDHMGPSRFAPGSGMDVRPHPHIGLSTLTYLFAGQIMHRDSLGCVQNIQPGAVNWMTAGRGIVHSERTPDELRVGGFDIHGLQIWIALPDGCEEVEPSFTHHPAADLPLINRDGTRMTLIAGEAFERRSPVHTYSPLFLLDVEVAPGANVVFPGGYTERAMYIIEGEVEMAGQAYRSGRLLALRNDSEHPAVARSAGRVMLLGGAPLASDRIVWWNFSSSSRARIETAKEDWRQGRFGQVPGETEFIPLPD